MGRSDMPDWQESASTLVNAINELSAHLEDGHIEFAQEKLAIISLNTGILCGTISRYEKPTTDINKEQISGLQRNLEKKKNEILTLLNTVGMLRATNNALGAKLAQYAEKEERIKNASRTTNRLARLAKKERR